MKRHKCNGAFALPSAFQNVESPASCTIGVSKIPYTAVARELVDFLELVIGSGTVFACKINTERTNWKSKGFGFVQFETEGFAARAFDLARKGCLKFQHAILHAKFATNDIQARPNTRFTGVQLHMGCLSGCDRLYVLWSSTVEATVEVDYENRMLTAFLSISGSSGSTKYKLMWFFDYIFSISLCTVQGKNNKSLLIQAKYAPQIYQQLANMKTAESASVVEDRYTFFKEAMEFPWSRTTDFTTNQSIGQSFAYCLELLNISQHVYDELFMKMADFGISTNLPSRKEIFLEAGISYSLTQELVPILLSSELNILPFHIAFKINSLVQSGILSGPALSRQFFDMLQPSITPIKFTQLALEKLASFKGACFEPVQWFQNQVTPLREQKLPPISLPMKLDEGLVLVHRLMVTPTRVYCLGPEIDVSNRVIRNHIRIVDCFLRVSFVEEDMTPLPSSALIVASDGIVQAGLKLKRTRVYERICKVLREGVTLGGRKFEFLAFSASQLREHSVWMFAASDGISAETIRKWMGDFTNIKNVAKCAVRMGLCFSSSMKTFNVYPHEVEDILDIEKFDGMDKYCFSDGIGKISLNFAMEVAIKCGFKKLGDNVPSAFQIRYGGCKGVVAVDPTSFYKLSLRPSMKKFSSSLLGLDILEWTHYIACHLNRQIIVLLSTLGIHDSIFEKMQQEEISHLNQVFTNKEVAIDILENACGGDFDRVMMDMLFAGYDPHLEPFLASMLQAFQFSQLQDLQKKSRIFVPKGRLLMGCLDETSTLEYGQVFVQVSTMPRTHGIFNDGLTPVEITGLNGSSKMACIVQGKVAVAKNPCLHPGDIRVLEAVCCPELQHMIDCIVFPQKGHRSHPNECSGSDLDGDIYFVTWDERLIPPSVDPPMDYFPPRPIILDHTPTIEEIQVYFADYMSNGSLGAIANAHLVFADTEMAMARDPKCIALAKLFSLAVDFPKTGVPVELPISLRPQSYPDFMEKDCKTGKLTYISSRILGKLYRAVDDAYTKISLSFTKEDALKVYDKDLVINGFEKYVGDAMVKKKLYNEKLNALMVYYGIKSEAELFSGFIVNIGGMCRKTSRDLKERAKQAVNALKKEARTWFTNANAMHTANSKTNDLDYGVYANASAWYHVTYHPEFWDQVDSEGIPNLSSQLLSFPWVIYDELLTIKRFRQAYRHCGAPNM